MTDAHAPKKVSYDHIWTGRQKLFSCFSTLALVGCIVVLWLYSVT